MTFRYFLIDTAGDVTGTNEADLLPSISDDDTIIVIIDTKASTYSNDDMDDAVIPEYEPEDDDSGNGSDSDLNT